MNSLMTRPRGWHAAIALALAVGLGVGVTLLVQESASVDSQMVHQGGHSSPEYFMEIAGETHEGIRTLIADGKYKCCLTEPCSYCFSDPEHQGRELVCDCLVDIMNGKHPCGECIGEILEGHGNPLISEYFATAIAEELGSSHLPTLKEIVFEKYDLPVAAQL